MPIDLVGPDLVISLQLDPYAPRAARYYVAQVDRPSPDLRDAVILLTSELVTRAVQQHGSDSDESVELRVWMPADVVRVELWAPPELLSLPLEHDGPHYDLLLLDQIADRWSVDTAEQPACIWFEIDRHVSRAEPEPEPQKRSIARHRRALPSRWRSGSAAG
jgi:hypothetical protein